MTNHSDELAHPKILTVKSISRIVFVYLLLIDLEERWKQKGSIRRGREENTKTTPEFPFEVCHWFYSRKVQLNCHIAYKKNWYSVPYEYVGMMVDIKVTETTLTTYYQNKRINVHKVFPDYVKNRYSTYDHDMPESVKVTKWDDERIKNGPVKLALTLER